MSLIEREYMGKSVEERQKERNKLIEKDNRRKELWSLYGKKHKTIFDKLRIRKLEKLNREEV